MAHPLAYITAGVGSWGGYFFMYSIKIPTITPTYISIIDSISKSVINVTSVWISIENGFRR